MRENPAVLRYGARRARPCGRLCRSSHQPWSDAPDGHEPCAPQSRGEVDRQKQHL